MKASFHQIDKVNNGDRSLGSSLETLSEITTEPGAYIEHNNIRIRVDNFSRGAKYCTGDIIKQQTRNIPPQAPNGSDLKPVYIPLGHRSAFLYHYATDVLIYQRNRDCISPMALMEFIPIKTDHNGFILQHIMDIDEIQDIMQQGARKLTVKFAQPNNYAAIEAEDDNKVLSLNQLRSVFDAEYIEVSCGFGSSKSGSMNRKTIVSFLRDLRRARLDTKKIQIKSEDSGEILDLLGKTMTYEDKSVNVADEKDIEAHYTARRQFIIDAYNANEEALLELFEQAA